MHNEEVHKLYAPPNSIKLVKLRMIWWTEYAARME